VKLGEIASFLKGEIAGPPGGEAVEITGAAGLGDAQEGDITFIASPKYLRDVFSSKASAVIVKDQVSDLKIAQLKVTHPYRAFAELLKLLYVRQHSPSGISSDAFVSGKAQTGDDVSVYPFAYLSDGVRVGNRTVICPNAFLGENTIVGEECVIHSNVTIRENVKIGNRVIIHSGSVIGSDGFGYIFDEGIHNKIPQVGGVIIEDDVEIGSNVSVDRATTGNTIIGKGTKIDNLVQIGHNVKIGRHCVIIAQVGIGGSTEIGDYVTLAGQVGVSDHTTVESGTMVGAQSGIMGQVSKGIYSGSPAFNHREWLKAQVVFAKLPELNKKIRELEEKLKEIERRNPA
jgi:UDP-3-O-[3-hydroxymyristoyl] glucosamine N-acyltransferase